MSVGENETAIVLADPSVFPALGQPPPAELGPGAERIGVLLLGENSDGFNSFWSARIYFSLPGEASAEHVARAVGSLFRILEDRALSARARRSLA
jgi:hypothetical protein